MARKLQWIGLAALSLALTGCVTSTDKFTAVQLENESLRQKLGEAEAGKRAADAQRDAYKGQLAALMDGSQGREALTLNQAQQIANLQSQLADLNSRYEKALSEAGRVGSPLPAAVSNALDAFATQNPDLVDFDKARGIVKFKSDLTFATGSSELTDKAKQAITRFSQILNNDAARSYELMIAGHTDNTPVVNPATKAKHPDNWYLSSHRAISVGDELIKNQVASARVAVVGYADQRPIASNTGTEGKAQNRRVEVLILPSTIRSAVANTSTKKPADTTAKKPTLNKDNIVAPVDNRPIINK